MQELTPKKKQFETKNVAGRTDLIKQKLHKIK